MKYPSYQHLPLDESWDAIIIGSGIGGLAAAALLSLSAGKRVLVLERHYTAGGFTHVFHRPGYEWDVGLHYVGQMQAGSPLRAIFDSITNGALDWAPAPDIYDRMVFPSREYDFPSGRERFRERMKQYFPS